MRSKRLVWAKRFSVSCHRITSFKSFFGSSIFSVNWLELLLWVHRRNILLPYLTTLDPSKFIILVSWRNCSWVQHWWLKHSIFLWVGIILYEKVIYNIDTLYRFSLREYRVLLLWSIVSLSSSRHSSLPRFLNAFHNAFERVCFVLLWF